MSIFTNITGLLLLLLTSIAATTMSGRFVLHHDNDNVCKTSPCPNWTGRNLATGELFYFDRLSGDPTQVGGPEVDAWARGRGVLVVGAFNKMSNRTNLNWATIFEVAHVIGPARNQ